MAAPILIQLSKDLSYKLQDPVSAGDANGKRLSADNRLGYLVRAYRRFLRLVVVLYPDLIAKLFNKYYLIATLTTDAAGVFDASTYAEVHEIFVKQPDEESYERATYEPPQDFQSIKLGQSEFYKPDLNDRNYYWSMLDGKVNVVPATTYDVSLTYRSNVAEAVAAGGYSGSVDFDIPFEYTDLLLTLAAGEAYMDVGDAQMIQAYRTDTKEQLELLFAISKKEEQEGTSDAQIN